MTGVLCGDSRFEFHCCVFRRHATALGVNEERMTEMEGGLIEAGREMVLMHGVYSARNLDADGSQEFNITQRPNTHTSSSASCPQESLHQGSYINLL